MYEADFAGRPVKEYEPGGGLDDPAGTIYKLGYGDEAVEMEEPLSAVLAQFLEEDGVEQAPGIVIGAWAEVGVADEGAGEMVEALVAAREKLPNLRAIYFGDIEQEESEISWIVQADVSPLFTAYPLEHFKVRGNQGLSLGTLDSENLKSLVIETGGLNAAVVRQVAAGKLPALEKLDLWLGSSEYGATWTMDDIAPILAGDNLPSLNFLGLCNSEQQDAIAIAAAAAPVTARLHTLDLSMGNMTDAGALALLESPAVKKLARLNLNHHYITDEVAARCKDLGIEVNIDEKCEEDEYDGEVYRYIEVSE
jgi:hypothetical protein